MFVSMNNKDIATDHYEVEYIRQWHDLGGMLLPKVELDNIINNVEYNEYSSIEALETSLKESFEAYNDYLEQYTLYIIDKYFADTHNLDEMAEDAYAQWIEAIKADATKEFEMGDVEQEAYEKIIGSLK